MLFNKDVIIIIIKKGLLSHGRNSPLIGFWSWIIERLGLSIIHD